VFLLMATGWIVWGMFGAALALCLARSVLTEGMLS
jgi:hypothetical protein